MHALSKAVSLSLVMFRKSYSRAIARHLVNYDMHMCMDIFTSHILHEVYDVSILQFKNEIN